MYVINHTYAVQNSDGTVSSYHVPDLWKIAQHFPTTQKPLEYWVGRINNYINTFTPEDWLRVIEADLSYPIILNGKVGVADGCHRIVKAMLLGYDQINAIEIPHLPNPIRVWASWEEYDTNP